jgi:hypothetical protein
MAGIRPVDLPTGTPTTDAALIFDSGASVQKCAPIDLMNAARPLATQAQAESGTDNVAVMSSLRVAQAIDAQAVLPADLAAPAGAGLVGFIQDGTGAIERTALGKMRDRVSVRDFGAKGDATGDDTSAIQAAIDHVATYGGLVWFPVGTYATSKTIEINSNNTLLVGEASGSGSESYSGAPQGYAVEIRSTAAVGIQINGPITGWGIQNIGVVIWGTVPNSIGIANIGGNQGDCRNIAVFNATNAGIWDSTSSAWPAEHNSWTNVHVLMPLSGSPNAIGILISGSTAGGDTYFNTWNNIIITPNNSGHTGIYMGYCDTLTITNLEIKPASAKGIVFDYTINNLFPSSICFYHIDMYNNSITNIGAPGAGVGENQIFGFSKGNGSLVPHIKNLRIMDVPFFSRTKLYLNSAQSIGNAGTIVALNAVDTDLDGIAVIANNRITPYRPGTYRVTGQIMAAAGPATSQVIVTLAKNGFATQFAYGFALNAAAQASALTTGWVTVNGTTDYINLIGQVTGGSVAIQTGAMNTWLMLEGPL